MEGLSDTLHAGTILLPLILELDGIFSSRIEQNLSPPDKTTIQLRRTSGRKSIRELRNGRDVPEDDSHLRAFNVEKAKESYIDFLETWSREQRTDR
jgi:hypothetical protein